MVIYFISTQLIFQHMYFFKKHIQSDQNLYPNNW